jgi:ankyrin repeat protein
VTSPELTDDEISQLLAVLDLARSGETEELASFLRAGCPPNLTNAAGDSLLILAAYHSHADTVAMLLRHGADPERVNDRGQTALGAATFRQDIDAVKALLAAGADPAGGTRSALEIAEFFNLHQMTALLVSSDNPK